MGHWADIQKNVFTRWCNEYLKRRGIQIDDLYKDLADGVVLINLMEILTDPKKIGRYNKTPRIRVAKCDNLSICLKFIDAQGIKLVNIGAEEITDGNQRIILGLIWTLILRYQINMGLEDRDGNPKTSAKDELLEWVRSKIPEKNITGFTKQWNDGTALAALEEAICPGVFPDHAALDPAKKEDNCRRCIDLAYDEWGVPKLLAPDEMAHPKVDEHSMMTYVSYLRDLDPSKLVKKGPAPGEMAGKSCAHGPGLVEGVAGQPGEFVIETPADCKEPVKVEVFGPAGQALPAGDVKLNPSGANDGKWACVYEPKEPGTYKIHVTVGGHHVPGSVFTVEVLEDESIGGQGKVLVFYSTTSSTNKGKSDVVNMQRLFEAKQIHKRPDFEPWVPVDIMDRADREAIFRTAGTRNLPIVFIDDKYAGDFDTMQELEENGKLDKLLRYNPNIPWN